MLWHIFQNGWEDKEFIAHRVYGMDDIRKEVEKWSPDQVESVTGLKEAQVKRIAEIFAKQRPSTLIWAMGQTQYSFGTANVRASCIFLLATGNVGVPGTGANIFRGHDNVQGATDLGLDVTTLPLYYGLAEDAWRHWCRVWEVDYDWMLARFVNKTFMQSPGVTSTRWFDAGHHEGHVHHGAWRQHDHTHARSGQRHREARSPGRVRSLSNDLGGALRA
jgi:formate dehydrogenase major subunit